MYKTRFAAWGIRKYGVASITKSINRRVIHRLAQRGLSDVSGSRVLLDPIELQERSQENEFAEDMGHLNMSNTSSQTSTINHTPDRSRDTSRPSSSDRSSIMTPESSSSSNAHCTSPLPLKIRQDWSENIRDIETYAPAPRRPSEMSRSVPPSWSQSSHSDDTMVTDQIVEHVMRFSSPSTFGFPRPNETFETLMAAPLDSSSYQSDSLGHRLGVNQGMDRNLDLMFPQAETWTSLCLWVNVLLGQERTSEAHDAMQWAAMIYQRLVQEKDDEILLILNYVLAILVLHRKQALAAELLSQAQSAASTYLEHNDPVMVSIRFMIAMAQKRSKSCGIRILQLRQVAEQMKAVWGDDHPYCITADYQLAWRLALESDLRFEALSMLRQTQLRSERLFGSLHIQTVALITTQARVLGHLGYHLEAEKTMSESLQRMERWNITKDYPYYVEAKRRHKMLSEELARVKLR